MHKPNQRVLTFAASAILTVAGVPRLLAAAPAITVIENAASNIVPGLPNAPLAQGSIFIIKGSGLGPSSISIASKPFQSTTLSGASVAVAVGSTTVNALMYYTSDGQVAALLPSNTPTGTGMFTVTYNGQTSSAAAHGIAATNPAVFTVDSTGSGPGIVTYADYSLVSSYKADNCGGPNTTCGAANPGDTLILWATGLGPVSGDDASGAGLGVNMPNLPLKLWIGGVQASVLYQGRSGCCIGEDQIVFTVPNNVPTGCAVPMVVQVGTFVSNTTPIPVATGRRSCNLFDPSIANVDVKQLAGTISIGIPELDHFLNDAGTGFQDYLQPNFYSITVPTSVQPFAGTYLGNPPLGTCTAQTSFGNGNPAFQNVMPLDAGSTFTVTGPNGSMTVTGKPGDQVSLSAAGTFLVPGNYTITGSGGKDIGPFSATVAIPALPNLTSPASPTGFSVARTKGLTVTWTSNNSQSHVEIELVSFFNSSTAAQINCLAPVSAGTFTIPDYVLLALPNGNGTNFYFQPGDGAGAASIATFPAQGLFEGFAQTFVDGIRFGGFTITN